jgi:patatin-like phospholipase/acyl hydrolase
MATTAAPTYFRAFRDIGNLSLVDGGVWANNPAMVAIGEALGPLQQQRDSVSLLSIGTMLGLPNDRRLLNQAGKITWSKHLPDVLLSATARGVDNQARFLLGDERYLRVNVTAPADDVSLDDVDAIEQLIARAHHVSRHALPSINAMFLGTRALQYEPAFNLEYAS